MPTVTVGQLLVNAALPDDMRNYDRVLDAKGVSKLLSEVAQKHPEKYNEVSYKLNQIGKDVATATGGTSFSITDIMKTEGARKRRDALRQRIEQVLDGPDDDTKLNDKILALVDGVNDEEDILAETLAEGNPLGVQIKGSGRGNAGSLKSLRGSDMLYEDHRGRRIPIPILRSYSEGLTPEEYWAATYGSRQGVIATKMATADAGYFGKQLNQIAHRLMVTALDDDKEPDTLRGLPVDVDDVDNEGALLAAPTAGYPRNTVLTPKILQDIQRKGSKRILVRSPVASQSPDGGVFARDVGIREQGRMPQTGEMVGLSAAQAISEPVSQGQLSAKHTGGVAGQSKAVSGFDYFNQLIQVPKTFKAGAAHSNVDGMVRKIEPAPAGGFYVTIDNEEHYVPAGFEPNVKRGQNVEAGDVISDGIPNPSIITQHKGIGEGRRYFIKAFTNALKDAGLSAHRRNVELISRGLINHVRMNEEYDDYTPDEVVPYSVLEADYEPREGTEDVSVDSAKGMYLERPYLHYTIGTPVRPSVVSDLKEFGVNSIRAHRQPPSFQPEMVRAMYNLQHDPDWLTRMYGSGLKKGLLNAVHEGGTSNIEGTSFVPARVKGVDFGRRGLIQQEAKNVVPTGR